MSDHFGEIPISAGRKEKSPTPPAPRKRSSQSSRSRHQLSKGKKRFLYLLGAVAILCIGLLASGFLLVPKLIEAKLPKYIQEETGLFTSIGKTTFNPLNFKVELQQVELDQLVEKNTQSTLLSFDSIAMDLDLSSLLRNGFVCDSLTLDKAALNIFRTKDKRYNISTFFNGKKKLTPSDMIEFAELPFLFSLNNINITNSKIVFNDNVTGKTHNVDAISLSLPTLSNFPYVTTTYVEPHFSAVINGSPVELSSAPTKLDTDKKHKTKTSLTFDLHDFDLALYSNYFSSALPVAITKGKATGKLQLSFDEENNAGLTIGFQSKLVDLQIQSKDKAIILDTPETNVKGLFRPLTLAVNFNDIYFNKPKLKVSKNYSNKTLAPLLPSPDTTTAEKDKTTTLTIHRLIAEDGQVTIEKNDEEKDQIIASIQLSLQNFFTGSIAGSEENRTKGAFKLQGTFQPSKANIVWQGKYLGKGSFLGTLRAKNFQLSDFTFLNKLPPGQPPKGKGTLLGQFQIDYSGDSTHPFIYRLTEGTLTLAPLKLFNKNRTWLTAQNTKIHGIQASSGRVDLGKITLRDAALTLIDAKPLEPLFEILPGKKRVIPEIDFKGQVTLLNSNSGKTMLLPKTQFIVSPSQAKKDGARTLKATATTQGGGKITASGALSPAAAKVNLKLDFSNVDATEILPLIMPPPHENMQGKFSGKGNWTFPTPKYSGSLAVSKGAYPGKSPGRKHTWELLKFDKVQLSHAPFSAHAENFNIEGYKLQLGKNSHLDWPRAHCQQFNYKEQPFSLSCNSLELDTPFLAYPVLTTSSHPIVTLQRLLTAQNRDPGKKEKKEKQVPQLKFPLITINKGKVAYTDHRLSPAWKINILQIFGKIVGLDSSKPSENCHFNLNGTIGSSPLTLKGKSQFYTTPASTQYTMETRSFPIASFGVQIPKLLDIQRNGKVDLKLNSVWKDDEERGMAAYTFSSVHPISSNSESALTLALLNTRAAVFNLDIPILHRTGKIYKPLFTHTINHFSKLMVKTSIEPLLLAEKIFPFPIKGKFVEFQPGTTNLLEGEKKKLEAYKKLLNEHPHIQLILTGIVDQRDDKLALHEKFEKREMKRVDEINKARRKQWEEKYSNAQKSPTSPPPPFEGVLPKTVSVSNSDLLELAQNRENMVKEMLIHTLGVRSHRISLNETRLQSENSSAPGNQVRLSIGPLPGAPNNLANGGTTKLQAN